MLNNRQYQTEKVQFGGSIPVNWPYPYTFCLGKSTFYGDGVSSHHIMREDAVLGTCTHVRVLSSALDEGGAGQGSVLYPMRRSLRYDEHNAP